MVPVSKTVKARSELIDVAVSISLPLTACPKKLPEDGFRGRRHDPAEVRPESVEICVKTVVL